MRGGAFIFILVGFLIPLQIQALTVGETVVVSGRTPFTWTARMDSLHRIGQKQKGLAKCYTYRRLCDEVNTQGENYATSDWADRYVAEAEKNGNTDAIIEAMRYKMAMLFRFGWDKSYFKAVDTYMDYMISHGKMEPYYMLWSQKISFLLNVDKLGAALDESNKILEDAQGRNNKVGIALAFDAQARVSLVSGDVDSAYYLVERGLAVLGGSTKQESPFLRLNENLMAILKRMSKEKQLQQRALIVDNMYKEDRTLLHYAATAWIHLANIYLNHNNLKQGRLYLDKVIKSRTTDERLYLPLEINYYNRLGDYLHALQLCNRLDTVIGASKDHYKVEALSYRASVLYNLKRYQEAAVYYRKSAELQNIISASSLQQTMGQYHSMYQITKQEYQHGRKLMQYLIVSALMVGFCLVFFVVTRYRVSKQLSKKNKQLMIALERAKESDNMKTSFVQHVSHEIRTPINIITGYAQILTSADYELDSDTKNQMMKDLDKQSKEITGSVNELLELSETESHRYYQCNDVVMLNVLCQALLDEQRMRTTKALDMKVKAAQPNDLTLKTNEDALKIIIRHLLQNAVKFTDKGSVTLSIYPIADGVEITVEDTGIGIAEQYREKVFEKFFKIDSFKQGLGLGLTVARHVARLMDGNLYIDSAYQGGTRFVLTLKNG